MHVRFSSEKFKVLYESNEGSEEYPEGVVRKFRQRIEFIKAAPDERSLRAMKSLHFEKLAGLGGLHSIRLNHSFRLELTFEQDESGKVVVVVRISNHYQR